MTVAFTALWLVLLPLGGVGPVLAQPPSAVRAYCSHDGVQDWALSLLRKLIHHRVDFKTTAVQNQEISSAQRLSRTDNSEGAPGVLPETERVAGWLHRAGLLDNQIDGRTSAPFFIHWR